MKSGSGSVLVTVKKDKRLNRSNHVSDSVEQVELTEEQKAILKALDTLTEPAGCKVIGEQADMPWRSVMGKMRGLKKDGLVDSPVKGKYVISEKGKSAIA